MDLTSILTLALSGTVFAICFEKHTVGATMSGELATLLKKAAATRMTPEQEEEQRRSFAYGNSKIENDRITREIIDREAEALAGEDGSRD